MSADDYVLAAAAHVVLGGSKRWRKEILAELERLAREPFRRGGWLGICGLTLPRA